MSFDKVCYIGKDSIFYANEKELQILFGRLSDFSYFCATQ